jgi:hypothetical protein
MIGGFLVLGQPGYTFVTVFGVLYDLKLSASNLSYLYLCIYFEAF